MAVRTDNVVRMQLSHCLLVANCVKQLGHSETGRGSRRAFR
jgi:hypothetical protein